MASEARESAEAELARNVLAALDTFAHEQRELRSQVNIALMTLAARQVELEAVVNQLDAKFDLLSANDALCWRQVRRVLIGTVIIAVVVLIGYLLLERAGVL